MLYDSCLRRTRWTKWKVWAFSVLASCDMHDILNSHRPICYWQGNPLLHSVWVSLSLRRSSPSSLEKCDKVDIYDGRSIHTSIHIGKHEIIFKHHFRYSNKIQIFCNFRAVNYYWLKKKKFNTSRPEWGHSLKQLQSYKSHCLKIYFCEA